MNQITENIACNSDYYNNILDVNTSGRRFYYVLDNIEKSINYSIFPNLFNKPPLGGFVPVPKVDIETIVKYFNINFFNEPFSVIITNKTRRCGAVVLCIAIAAEHNCIVNSNDFIEDGKSMVGTIYKEWPVFIQNRIQNFPIIGKDTITIVYTQDIFHFTFHSTYPKFENGKCVAEEWKNKTKGAFHLKLDCIRRKRRSSVESPLVSLPQHEQPYFPFVYNKNSDMFMTTGSVIGKPPTNLYTSIKTNLDGNMCHNEDTLDLWYLHTNNRIFSFKDSSGVKKNYIQDVIGPIYNYIVNQINHSMSLPPEHEWHLERPYTFENDETPTPIDCTILPVTPYIIRCKSDPEYNELINDSLLNKIRLANNTPSAGKVRSSKGGLNNKIDKFRTKRNRIASRANVRRFSIKSHSKLSV